MIIYHLISWSSFHHFSSALCYFIDDAFQLGIFSQSCETAKIVPLFKSGNNQSFTNYRPISILTCSAKIFEKLLFRCLTSFFRKHSVLTKTQYGFHSDKCTNLAILDVIMAGYDNVNKKSIFRLNSIRF